MPRKRSNAPSPELLSHRWYLPEWAKLKKKRQADAQRELGWPKSSASERWNGKQRYTQDLVDEVARWLKIEPYELLMSPAEAQALKRLRQTAQEIVQGQPAEPVTEKAGKRQA